MAPDLFILTPKEWSQPTPIPNALDFPQTKVPPSHGNKEKSESLPSLFLVLGQPRKLSLSLRPWVIRGLRLPSHLSCPLWASPGHAWVWAVPGASAGAGGGPKHTWGSHQPPPFICPGGGEERTCPGLLPLAGGKWWLSCYQMPLGILLIRPC